MTTVQPVSTESPCRGFLKRALGTLAIAALAAFAGVWSTPLLAADPCPDADGDGWGVQVPDDCDATGLTGLGDCNDGNGDINPGEAEVCGNLVDDNCDSDVDFGYLEDSFGTPTPEQDIYEGGTCFLSDPGGCSWMGDPPMPPPGGCCLTAGHKVCDMDLAGVHCESNTPGGDIIDHVAEGPQNAANCFAGIDNDCDSNVDEAMDGRALSRPCYDGPAGTMGVGGCMAGSGPMSNIKAGKLRALAVSSAKRLPQLPEVPTLNELGYTGMEDYTWVGIYELFGNELVLGVSYLNEVPGAPQIATLTVLLGVLLFLVRVFEELLFHTGRVDAAGHEHGQVGDDPLVAVLAHLHDAEDLVQGAVPRPARQGEAVAGLRGDAVRPGRRGGRRGRTWPGSSTWLAVDRRGS